MNQTTSRSQKVELKKQQLKEILLQHYGLAVISSKKVRGIFLLITDRGKYSFKKAEELPDLDFVVGCLRLIRNNGFPYVPQLVPTLTGETNVRYEGGSYYLDEWVEGVELPVGKHYEEPLGRALARYHLASQRMAVPSTSIRNNYGKRSAFLLKCNTKLHDWLQKGEFAGDFDKQALNFLIYRCWLAYLYIRDATADPKTVLPALCHGSPHHENIIIDPQSNIWFIDFESLIYAERMLDVAQLVHYYGHPFQWDSSVIARLMDSYQRNYGTPFSREEVRCFLSYLAFPRRLYNAMNKYFESEKPSEKHYKKLKKLIEMEYAKERFLRTYPLQG